MNLPSLAVVVPAFNAARHLVAAIESVVATGYPNIEVIIVNDGSTDQTSRIASELARRWTTCRVLHHSNCANLGVSASRNLAIESTSADWISFLDADDLYLPSRFEVFIARHREGVDFDALYQSAIIQIDSDGAAPFADETTVFGLPGAPIGAELLSLLLTGASWHTSAITVRRSVLRQTGLFDPLKRIAEDSEVWIKLAASARVIGGDPNVPVSIYRRHGSNTYEFDDAHRVALLQAMLDAASWARRQRSGCAQVEPFDRGIPRFLQHCLIATRESGRVDIAWKLVATALRRRGRYLLASGNPKQVAALLRDWRPSPQPTAYRSRVR